MDTERSAGRRIAKRIAASLAAAACLGTLLWPAQIYAAQVQTETSAEIPAVEAFATVSISDFGGTVTIRSGEGYGVSCEGEESLQPSVSYEEDKLLIDVADTGAGMDEETLMRIRGKLEGGEDTPLDEDIVGIGLGNINRRIKGMYEGGSLSINSTLGEGTTILMTLPLHRVDD